MYALFSFLATFRTIIFIPCKHFCNFHVSRENFPHTDLADLADASRFALAAVRLNTLGIADRMRELLSMQPYFVRSA